MTTYIVIAIVFTLISASLWFFFDSRNWTETQGSIDYINLEEIHNDIVSPMSTNKRFTEYKINLRYQYTVNDRTYSGTQLYPLIPNVFSERTHALQLIDTYSTEKPASVFYNPSQPEQSCLITSKTISVKSYIIMLSVFAFIGLIFVIGMKYFSHLFSD